MIRTLLLISIIGLSFCKEESRPREVELERARKEAIQMIKNSVLCYTKNGKCLCCNSYDPHSETPSCEVGQNTSFSFPSCESVKAFGFRLLEFE